MYRAESFGFEITTTNDKVSAILAAIEYAKVGTDAEVIDLQTGETIFRMIS